MFKIFYAFTIAFSFLSFTHQAYAKSDLLGITYITFEEENTSNSVTINYHSKGNHNESWVQFGEISCELFQCQYPNKIKGTFSQLKGIKKTFHHVKLSQLQPNTTYYFIVGDADTGQSKEMKFQTPPNNESEIRFMNGGDMGDSKSIPDISENSMKEEPHAILLGGDLAYANGNLKNEGRWQSWFEVMNQVWTTPSGYLVPLVVAIGNHESDIQFGGNQNSSPFYKAYFPQGGSSYFTRKFGSHTQLFILDSGHTASHGGDQARWLEKQFQNSNHIKNKVAVYHVPLFPSSRSYFDFFSSLGRKYWLKLFDKYQLTLALEHHDHGLKRTKVLFDGKEATKGTVYLGDGCFGKSPRSVDSDRDYLAHAESEKHVWLLTADSKHLQAKALGKNDKVFDHIEVINDQNSTHVRELPLTH